MYVWYNGKEKILLKPETIKWSLLKIHTSRICESISLYI